MASMNLVFRPSTKQGHHQGSLSLRLIHNRQSKTITLTGCRIYSEEWDKASQNIIYPEGNTTRIGYLEELELTINHEMSMISEFILTLERQGRYTLHDLMLLYSRKKDNGKLLSYAGELAKVMERRGQYRTARAYRTVTKGIVMYNKGNDIPLYHINGCLIKDFETYLKNEGKLPNTLSYYMRNLRAIYNKAVKDKRIIKRKDENPFEDVYTGITKTMKRSLTLEEVKKIVELDFVSLLHKEHIDIQEFKNLQNIHISKRYFAFSFFCRGLCFIDLAYLKKSNIRGGVLRYVRKKTGGQIEVNITREMQEIIDSFKDDAVDSPYLFPIIKDMDKPARLQYESALRTQNNRLKKLAKLAGVHKNLSTHIARHTWATIGKIINLPTSVISEGLGHTSENTTLIYLAQLDNSVLDDANRRIALTIHNPVGVQIASYI